jgi:hypothetical protein
MGRCLPSLSSSAPSTRLERFEIDHRGPRSPEPRISTGRSQSSTSSFRSSSFYASLAFHRPSLRQELPNPLRNSRRPSRRMMSRYRLPPWCAPHSRNPSTTLNTLPGAGVPRAYTHRSIPQPLAQAERHRQAARRGHASAGSISRQSDLAARLRRPLSSNVGPRESRPMCVPCFHTSLLAQVILSEPSPSTAL